MNLEFVTRELNAAYDTKANIHSALRDMAQQEEELNSQLGLIELKIKTLQVLFSQPIAVSIKPYTYNNYEVSAAAKENSAPIPENVDPTKAAPVKKVAKRKK